jgi:hypothetical protein
MEKEPKLIILQDGTKLISMISEVVGDIGQPNCKLINPYVIQDTGKLDPWLFEYTLQSSFMVHSDKFLTIAKPLNSHIHAYKKATEETE